MDLLLDLKLDEDAESVEAAVTDAAASFSPEAQYRGGVRWLRRLAREMEAARQSPEAEAPAEDAQERVSPMRAAASRWKTPTKLPWFATEPESPPPWKDTSKKMWERTYALIEAHPHMAYEQMAAELYGEASQKAKSNVRSQCAQLKKERLARAVADGLWEVIPPEERGADAESSEEGDTGEGGEAD